MAPATVALTVSVALCTHNGERFIEEQLSSILGQSQPPTQLVISDDASKDNTIALVTATIAQWRVAHPETLLSVTRINNPVALGVVANFAGAIAATEGDLVALCDQDDVWPVGRLERMIAVFDSTPQLLLLHTDATLIDASGRSTGQSLFGSLGVGDATKRAVHSGYAYESLMKRNIVTGATTVFRRDLANAALPFPPSWVHDEWLAIVAAAVGVVDLLDEKLIEYRQHEANQIGVERLSFTGKAGRMLAPGAGRNRRLLARAEQLAERIAGLDVSPQRTAAAGQKLLHEQIRSGLGRRRLSRVLPVVRELTTGRYGKFGRGVPDAVRDLLQPL